MVQRSPRRHRAAAGTPRRQPRVRRASAGLSATSAFGFERLDVRGTTLTTEAAIRDQLGLTAGTNLVGLTTDPIEGRLRRLPSIRDVEVSVGLPDVLHVAVT